MAWLYDLISLRVCLFIYRGLDSLLLPLPTHCPTFAKHLPMSPSSDNLLDPNGNPQINNTPSSSNIAASLPTQSPVAGDPAPHPRVQASTPSYANYIRFGMAYHDSSNHTQVQGQPDAHTEQLASPGQSLNHPMVLNMRAAETLPQGPLPPRVPSYMEELITLCVPAKLWGEILPIALIIAKTKVNWKHIKGVVEYIDPGNGWVLLPFSLFLTKSMSGLIGHGLSKVLTLF